MIKWVKRAIETASDWFSSGYGLDDLARRLGVQSGSLEAIDLSYQRFTIRKKTGGVRNIDAPNPDLKKIQKVILRRLLSRLAVHPQAVGFQPGISFVTNARCHEYQAVVIRIDLVDFFPSISRQTVEQYFRRIGWKRRPARILADLTTHQQALPQGAPTSPRISNLVNYLLDHHLAGIAHRHQAIYTRYADDITFSLSKDVEVSSLLKDVLDAIGLAGYQTHRGKKKFTVRRRRHRQVVNGLVVNESAKLPREKRRWLRSVRHRAKLVNAGGYLGPRPTLNETQLAGWNALEAMIERRGETKQADE